MNHTGSFDKVIETFHREYFGDLYRIKARTIPEIFVTEEHPFYVYNNVSKSFDWCAAKDLKKDIHWLVEHKGKHSDSNVSGAMEFLYYTVNDEKSFVIPIEPDLMKLMGYYLSQGSLASGKKGKSGYKENKYLFYRVDFTFNSKKVNIIDNVVYLMGKYFGVTATYRYKENTTVINFKSRKAYEFFLQTCGTISYNKHISDTIFEVAQSQKDLLNIVIGFILGDGNVDWQGCALYSTSNQLFYQLRDVLLANDIVGSLTIRTKDKHHSSIVNGKIITQKHNLYTLAIYGKYAEKLISNIPELSFISKTQRTFVRDLGDYFGYPIVSITHSKSVLAPVYNLKIEKENSYHAGNVAVHNCSCLPGQDNTCGKRFSWDNVGKMPEGWDHKYLFSRLGYNLKMTELAGSMGSSQIDRLDEIVSNRRVNYSLLWEGLHECAGIDCITFLEGSNPSPFGFPIICQPNVNVDKFIQFLEEHKIGTRRVFGGNLTRQPGFMNLPYILGGSLEGSDFVMNNVFWVATWSGLTKPMLDYMIETIWKFFEE